MPALTRFDPDYSSDELETLDREYTVLEALSGHLILQIRELERQLERYQGRMTHLHDQATEILNDIKREERTAASWAAYKAAGREIIAAQQLKKGGAQ
jgi:hypothetical protein